MTTQTIDQIDQKIAEFNRRLDALVSMMRDSPLAGAAKAHPRKTVSLVQWMNFTRQPHFLVDNIRDLVKIIENGGTVDDIDPSVRLRLHQANELDQLCQLYADIHNVPRDDSGAPIWSQVSPIDMVTTTV